MNDRDRKPPSIRRNPDNLSVITMDADTPHIVVELDAPGDPAPWGQLHPLGPTIRERVAESPSLIAAYACPHGAVAIMLVSQMPTNPQEERRAEAVVRQHLLEYLKEGHGKPKLNVTFPQERRACGKAYREESGEEV